MQDLAHFLIALGAQIEGVGTNCITIEGGQPARTKTEVTHTIGPDHIEVGSFIGLAAVTQLRAANRGRRHRASSLDAHGLRAARNRMRVDGDDLIVPAKQTRKIQADMGDHVPKLEDQPWPAFPADTMSIAIVTATQCEGLIMMHEKMFESRLFFVDKLIDDGREDRAVRSASRARSRTVAAPRRDARLARHPGGNGAAHRRALR